MKKLFSFAAALVVAMVVLVSCASENTKKANAAIEALSNNNLEEAAKLAGELYAVKDQLTAGEAVVTLATLNGLANKASEAQDPQANTYISEIIDLYETANAKDSAGVKAASETANVDFASIVDQYKQALAALAQAEAEAAAAAAAADSTAADSTEAEVEAE